VLITPSLGVPNWSVIYINTAPAITQQGWHMIAMVNQFSAKG
jgi:hypothetical protein